MRFKHDVAHADNLDFFMREKHADSAHFASSYRACPRQYSPHRRTAALHGRATGHALPKRPIVRFIGRRTNQAVQQPRIGIHADVRLHANMPLASLLGLMHLRVTALLG